MKGGETCKVNINIPNDQKSFEAYRWGGSSLIGNCGFFVQMNLKTEEGKEPPKRRDIFITVDDKGKPTKVESQTSADVDYTDTITNITDKTDLKTILKDLGYPRIFKDNEDVHVEKGKYSFPEEKAPTPTTESVESTKTTTDVEGDRFTIKQDIEKVTHKGVDVLKTVGPVKLFDKNDKEVDKMEGEEEKTEEVREIVNKGNVAKVLCLPISLKLGSAEDTKVLFNLSDNSRKLKEIEEEDNGLKATRGTEHLQAKKEALKTSLKLLMDKVSTITGMNLARGKDGDLNDSLTNYNTIKTNLEKNLEKNSENVLEGLEDPLPMQIYKMINGSDEPMVTGMVLEGDALYKFCDAIQKKVDGLINALENVTKFERINGILTVFKRPTTLISVLQTEKQSVATTITINKFLDEIQSYYLTPENLEISGSMADRSQEELKSDSARDSEKKRIKLQRDFGKAANTFRKGVGNAGKGFGSLFGFGKTKKKPEELAVGTEGAPAEGVPPTGGGKRKTRKNKARKTRRKVQRKRRQSKKH